MKKSISYKNGHSLSYAEYGDMNGYPILIQHGMIASINSYHLFDRLIEAGARLICIARPGYGDSSPYVMNNIGEWADIVSVLVDELELAQFDVLGMSSGAPYSYALGFGLPDKVRKIFILSGTPALYDEGIASFWPYEINKHATIPELQKLAYELFFSHGSNLESDDNKDSMRNDCFGIAQDLKIRCLDWGFKLSDVAAKVYMRHSKADEAVPFVTAEMTARLLPCCEFEARENDVHFSDEILDDFIRTVMMRHYAK